MSGPMVNTLKSREINQDIIKELFIKIDQLQKEELAKLLIFNESFNWKAVLLPILKIKYDFETIIDFYSETIKLGNQFKLKSLMPSRLYSAHLNYYYGVLVEQSIREIKRKDFEKEKNILSKSSFDSIDNEIFIFLYGKSKLNLWKEFSLNFRLKSKSYYVPSKIYCNESENFDYWLSKRRILRCTRELNASLLSRGLEYLKGFGIYE
ncbi:MAG: hypothetical protein CL769_01290 [Chloroflexi bacterium]|nr:hypothetical protein [Chloroflexota bacterium]|tara:strand:+ start:3937 stop:4560 length:624 start_codon:yes stop_codon:yes gene_type:complete